ncbi:MAG: hypothetical protein ACRCT2_13855 [Plesiomonas shigelloides]
MHEIFLFLKPDRTLAIAATQPKDTPWESIASDIPSAHLRTRITFAAIEQSDLAQEPVLAIYPDGCTTIVHPKARSTSVS